MSISFSLQAKASPDWTCDNGFKSSLGRAYISKLQLNSNGKYDLSIGSSPSDGSGGKTIEPLSIISNLDCKFSKNNNGAIVNCSNEADVGEWFSMSSSFNTTTSIDSDGSLSSRSYVQVIVSSGIEKINVLLKQISGDKAVVRYNVLLDIPSSKCGF